MFAIVQSVFTKVQSRPAMMFIGHGLISALGIGCPLALHSPTHADPLKIRDITLYERLSSAIQTREKLIRSLEVVYPERLEQRDSHRGLSPAEPRQAPSLLSCGSYVELNGIERWIRYRGTKPRDDLLVLSPQELRSVWEGVVRPSAAVSDGTNTLILTPRADALSVWDGMYVQRVDTSIRSGGMNCCVLFGEQWLSNVLVEWTLKSATQHDHGLSFEFQTKSGGSTVSIDADQHGYPRALLWKRNGKPAFHAEVVETHMQDSVPLPLHGMLEYWSGPGARISCGFEYLQPRVPLEESSSILVVPAEVARFQPLIQVIDERGATSIVLDGSDFDASPEDSSVSRWPLANLVLAGTGVVSMLLGCLFLLHQRRAKT